MKIIEGKSLASFTTFRIGGNARFFCVVENIEDLKEAVHFAKEKKIPFSTLGGGSNILISDKGFDGLVVKMEIKGITSEASSQDFFTIRAGAGEDWDAFVAWTVDNGYSGLENLSLIPGTVGAAPVQNIGAYGVEVGNLIESVEVFDTLDSKFKTLSRDECSFSYRDSLFKCEKGRYIIVSVLFKLRKDTAPDISYKDLKGYFEKNGSTSIENSTEGAGLQSGALSPRKAHFPGGKWLKGKSRPSTPLISKPSIAEVRKAVITIRTAKLPDVRKVGTAGSFFKNPILSKEKFDELKKKYPELPGFLESDGRIKIPLAWIIDKVCGLKGKSWGKAGIHDTQALVIVNHGGATYAEVEKVASEVEKAVKEKTGIVVEREVVVL